jgi:iron-sulfur cluster assembly protein
MLMVTENARQAIESIVTSGDLPEGSGLRIDAPDEPPPPSRTGTPLQLEVASQPSEQDQVVDEGPVKVFISPRVAPLLEDKVLDVRVDDGRLQFVIAPQHRDQEGQDGQGGQGGQGTQGAQDA